MMKWLNKGHEFDEIGYNLEGKKQVYLYGTGINAKEILRIFEKTNKWIKWEVFLVDRDPVKHVNGWEDKVVLSPKEFFEKKKENFFVIACPDNEAGDQIYNNLILHNIDKKDIYKGFYFIHTYLPIYFSYVHDMVFFASENILASTVCNLNCRDCLNFNPYIKEHVIETLENLKKSVDIFFNAVDLIYRFQITGGEPFLYKELIQFIEYIGKKHRDKIISFEIVTNGTVVPSDELCRIIKENDMYVYLDDYRMSIKNGYETYKKVMQKLIDYRIEYCNNYVERWIRMYPPINIEILEKEDELIKKYDKCGNPWSSLRNGIISSCNYAMYAKKAGIYIDVKEEYFDLSEFKPEMKKELTEFRLRFNEKGYVDFCKQCNGWLSINNEWCDPAIQKER